jgi:hypothetical protein
LPRDVMHYIFGVGATPIFQASVRFVYDDRRYSVLLLFPIFFRAAFKLLSASAVI